MVVDPTAECNFKNERECSLLERRLLQILAAQDRELKITARLLHDDLGQNVVALRLGLAALKENNESPSLRIAELEMLAAETAKNIQSLTFELRPTMLEDIGLLPSITAYIDYWSIRHGITADFQPICQRLSFGKFLDANLFRILQESLTNVARHAQCNRVDIVFRMQQGSLALVVEDDGCGFDVAALSNSPNQRSGSGIEEMRARAALAQGEFSIESRMGEGTKVTIIFPYEHSEP